LLGIIYFFQAGDGMCAAAAEGLTRIGATAELEEAANEERLDPDVRLTVIREMVAVGRDEALLRLIGSAGVNEDIRNVAAYLLGEANRGEALTKIVTLPGVSRKIQFVALGQLKEFRRISELKQLGTAPENSTEVRLMANEFVRMLEKESSR
jgi:hypothetical protein